LRGGFACTRTVAGKLAVRRIRAHIEPVTLETVGTLDYLLESIL